MTMPVFTVVHPMKQLDHVEAIGNRIEALLESAYAALGDIFNDIGRADEEAKERMCRDIDRAMLLTKMAQEYLADSQAAIELEYRQLAELGLHRMEKAA